MCRVIPCVLAWRPRLLEHHPVGPREHPGPFPPVSWCSLGSTSPLPPISPHLGCDLPPPLFVSASTFAQSVFPTHVAALATGFDWVEIGWRSLVPASARIRGCQP